MTYDFTSIIDRHGKDSIAVDLPDFFSPYKKGVQLKDGFDLIPMWVADMNFAAAPSIQKAMTERIKHPTFGYFDPRPEYYEKIMDWQKRRNGVTDLKPEYIGFENGVLGGVSSALRALCQPGESVLLHSPTYVGFTGVLNSCGYHIIRNPELRDKVCKAGENTHYNSLNLLSMYALLGAYTDEGEEWLDQLLPVLDGNVSYACDFIQSHWEGVSFSRPQGTYMLFIDCTEWCKAHNMSLPQLLNAGYEVGIVWQNGEDFFGPYCIRINLALPLSRVKEAFDRLDQYVFSK